MAGIDGSVIVTMKSWLLMTTFCRVSSTSRGIDVKAIQELVGMELGFFCAGSSSPITRLTGLGCLVHDHYSDEQLFHHFRPMTSSGGWCDGCRTGDGSMPVGAPSALW